MDRNANYYYRTTHSREAIALVDSAVKGAGYASLDDSPYRVWSPWEYNWAAVELMINLGVSIEWDEGCCRALVSGQKASMAIEEPLDEDRPACLRRAIVRAIAKVWDEKCGKST